MFINYRKIYVVEAFIKLNQNAKYKYISPFASLPLVCIHLFCIKLSYIGGCISQSPTHVIKVSNKESTSFVGIQVFYHSIESQFLVSEQRGSQVPLLNLLLLPTIKPTVDSTFPEKFSKRNQKNCHLVVFVDFAGTWKHTLNNYYCLFLSFWF